MDSYYYYVELSFCRYDPNLPIRSLKNMPIKYPSKTQKIYYEVALLKINIK